MDRPTHTDEVTQAFVAREIEVDIAMQSFTRVAGAIAKSLSAAGLDSSALLAKAVEQNLGGLGDLLARSIAEVERIGGALPNPSAQPHFILRLSERNGRLHKGHVCQ
ncbi:hypothetical protein COV83_04910 [Candidatus Peregrinibacteria bacterium CG11_big_fil_rev_8_21_14_0_20_49_14]|nr:MAG: hypothetical protein COV83_04910 [Candidatus Peregrinibacteria bacterium CG11_big_fil_rev_8_21_14_0_20_49_14]